MDLHSERGATGTEYALLVALGLAIMIVAVSVLGRSTTESFECPGYLFEGKTCVQSTAVTAPSPSPSASATPSPDPTSDPDPDPTSDPDPDPTASPCKNPTGKGKSCDKS